MGSSRCSPHQGGGRGPAKFSNEFPGVWSHVLTTGAGRGAQPRDRLVTETIKGHGDVRDHTVTWDLSAPSWEFIYKGSTGALGRGMTGDFLFSLLCLSHYL